jgi:hypothetical protein
MLSDEDWGLEDKGKASVANNSIQEVNIGSWRRGARRGVDLRREEEDDLLLRIYPDAGVRWLEVLVWGWTWAA